MRCLAVGGTGFLGGAILDALAEAGHAVAVPSRGRRTRALPRGVEAIRGDRHGHLSALAGRGFDWAFDTCAYGQDAVRRLAGALDAEPARHVMGSSPSVYGDWSETGITEDVPAPDATADDHGLAASPPPEDRASAVAHGASRGPLERACGRAAEARLGAWATALRVGLIVGAGDYADRLTW